MKLPLLLTICLLAGLLAHTQQLTIPELVKMRYQKLGQIDSTLRQKGYSVAWDNKDDKGCRMMMYSSIVSEHGMPVTRKVKISRVLNPAYLQIDYLVWMKTEFDAHRDWLVKNGYKKGETIDYGLGPMTSYTKAGKSIAICVTRPTIRFDPQVYEVRINNKEYK